MKALKTCIITDLRMLEHKSKLRHPECPARVKAILKMFQQKQLLNHPQVDYISQYDRMATDDDIKLIYTKKYVNYLKQLWPEDETKQSINVSDSYYNKHTEMAARLSAGGVLEGIDKIMQGEYANGFCVVRPPGHHSGEKPKINGFCVLNNVAMGARYLETKHDLSRIAILDYDIHEGDGTHHLFNQHKSILFISVHRYDRGSYYPGGPGGDFSNCGEGEAEGTKINIPLNIVSKKKRRYDFQAPGDNEYIYLYNRIIHPIIKEFDPQFILVSSGFDAARKDYLGGFTVTPNGYFYMTKRLKQFEKPILCVLEGGYHLGSTAQGATAVVKGLIDEQTLPQPVKGLSYSNIHMMCHLQPQYHQDLDEIIQHHGKYWKSLLSQQNMEYTRVIKKNTEKVFGVFNEESSSSSSQEEIEEGDKKEQEDKISQIYNKYQKDTAIKTVFKNFSYTNQRVHKLINPLQADFYDAKFPQRRFAPKYFGKEGDYLILENIFYKQKGATVVEVILSRQSKNTKLSQQAIMKEKNKQTQSSSQKLSFRIAGITTPQHKQDCLLIDDQGTIKKILNKIVDSKNKAAFIAFLTKLAGELKNAKRVYFGTSILLIKGKETSNIYWNNFYSWYPSETQDYSTIEGIENLVKFIQTLD